MNRIRIPIKKTLAAMTEILEGPEAIVAALANLGLGEPVAFPTETVYGLGADALDEDAVARVFAMKGRPAQNPLIVHVSDAQMAHELVETWSEDAQTLADDFWPGSLTLVLKKSDRVPSIVTAGGDTVAVRCPAHPIALGLIETLGKPLVGPSANPSGWISPTTSEHVALGFPDHDLLIIEGGSCRAGIESTVVDLTSDEPRILRAGVISHIEIAKALGKPVRIESNDDHDPDADTAHIRSPGVLGAHYQPKTPTKLVDSQTAQSAQSDVFLIAITEPSPDFKGRSRQMPADAAGYAREIYAAMHEGDSSGASEIWIERIPRIAEDGTVTTSDAPLWAAVLERLRRACR